MLDLATAYGAFASGGVRVRTHAVVSVEAPDGRTLHRHAAERTRVLHPTVAAEMNGMLGLAVRAGTARRAAIPGVQAAGKTGTTNGYRDAWFIGYTADLTGGVWVGNDDHSPMNHVTGGSLPAAMWREIMAFAHRGVPPREMPTVGREPDVTAALLGQGVTEIAPIGSAGDRGFAVVSARSAETWGDARPASRSR